MPSLMWLAVLTTRVRTVPSAAAKGTVADQGWFCPPAAIPATSPSGAVDAVPRTCTRRLSSTPVIRPPAVTGELTRAP